MGTHNIRLYTEVDKKYSGSNLKSTELLECALTGVCAVIRAKHSSFLFLYENVYCGYSLEVPQMKCHTSNEHPQYMFLRRNKIKYVSSLTLMCLLAKIFDIVISQV